MHAGSNQAESVHVWLLMDLEVGPENDKAGQRECGMVFRAEVVRISQMFFCPGLAFSEFERLMELVRFRHGFLRQD